MIRSDSFDKKGLPVGRPLCIADLTLLALHGPNPIQTLVLDKKGERCQLPNNKGWVAGRQRISPLD
jgi:hypothetical protein